METLTGGRALPNSFFASNGNSTKPLPSLVLKLFADIEGPAFHGVRSRAERGSVATMLLVKRWNDDTHRGQRVEALTPILASADVLKTSTRLRRQRLPSIETDRQS